MTGPAGKPPTDDDVSIDELRQAVEHMHGVPARFVEAVEVDERFNGGHWSVLNSASAPRHGIQVLPSAHANGARRSSHHDRLGVQQRKRVDAEARRAELRAVRREHGRGMSR
jgi:hypothetical protein